MTVTAYIALGSNLGNRRELLDRALTALRQDPRVEVTRVASHHETEPVGGPPGQGKYLNSAAELRTDLSARELLALLLDVERQLGRVRGVKNAARTIDLDLLLYGDEIIKEADLEVPHPRMHDRLFVLAPLAEIAGAVEHPLIKLTMQHLAAHAHAHGEMERVRDAQERLDRKIASTRALLRENPHPRKRRHLEQVAKALDQENEALTPQIEAVMALLKELHQDGSCHPH